MLAIILAASLNASAQVSAILPMLDEAGVGGDVKSLALPTVAPSADAGAPTPLSPAIINIKASVSRARDLEAAVVVARVQEGPGRAATCPRLFPAQPTRPNNGNGNGHERFRWGPALTQSFLFLGIQHGFAMTQSKTRRELDGPFFKDWFESVSNLGGWADGGRFFTNYISHPMGGALYGYIQIQNDPKGMKQVFGRDRRYWISRVKALGWSAVYSTQFELGPVGQAAIGNVGLHTPHTGAGKRKLSYVDVVVTPTLGSAWLVTEDILDRYMVRWVERQTQNRMLVWAARVGLNPMRAGANLLRFKAPWHRDTH